MNAVLKEAPVSFCRERIADVIGEIKPLLQAHWEEIAHYPDIPLKPDYDRYMAAEYKGQLRIFTARKGHTLIGYAIYAVAHGMHYSNCLVAVQDVLYLDPAYRRGRVGWRLIEHADNVLQAEGVGVVVQHQKIAHPALGQLLERMGYEQQDIIWTRRLHGL